MASIAAGGVVLDEAAQDDRVEELRTTGAGRKQVLGDHAFDLGRHPGTGRAAEKADLALVDDLVGEQAAGHLLEQVLGAQPPDLEVGGNPRAELDDLVVEEGNAYLERACHRGTVEILEQV